MASKKGLVEIIPTKRGIGNKKVGQRGLFVHPDVAKIHVEVVKEARYVTAADDAPVRPQYQTRDMVAAPARVAMRRGRPPRVNQTPPETAPEAPAAEVDTGTQ